MTDLLTLYGTQDPPAQARVLGVGDMRFRYEAGAMRHIRIKGVEAIRGIAFLVRDRDWGTLVPQISGEEVRQDGDALRIRYHARYDSAGAALDVDITITQDADGLRMAAEGRATGTFETNRAGFTVLHPITGVAGQPVRVTHGDGNVQDAHWPDLIAPWQPFMDITALGHRAGDHWVTCAFEGDTFEMEDQRQWGDASYKTYNRPLARPWPYQIADGSGLAQSVTLTWVPAASSVPARPVSGMPPVPFPQTALVLMPQDVPRLLAAPEDLAVVAPQRLLCHLDATLGDSRAQFDAFAAAQRACPEVAHDLELICPFATDPAQELAALAGQMHTAGFAPDSVMVCPGVDRQSTPPGSDWPECPPLAQVHAAAARAFAGITVGGGMVSFFPELNRKRPPPEALDFVSHGLCPIVHAADDLSVIETLETVPHITRSARAIIGDRAYRIGPATIAMRQNPYGSRTIPNPDQRRVCMADDDPRHRARFGAAYALGLATALAPAGIEVWTPAALYGPRGVIGPGGEHWPITGLLRALAGVAEESVTQARVAEGMAQLRVGGKRFRANLTDQAQADLPAFGWERA